MGEVFSDNTLANAILDRLLHHSSIIKISDGAFSDYIDTSSLLLKSEFSAS